jgi:PhnB protein
LKINPYLNFDANAEEAVDFLSIGWEDEEKTNMIFNKIGEDGKMLMPLSKQFWGDVFGMLQDKFGVNWMVNYTTKS